MIMFLQKFHDFNCNNKLLHFINSYIYDMKNKTAL